jgi:TolA-binding protein
VADPVRHDDLDAAIVALRDVGDTESSTIRATRERVMASLDRRHGTRRKRVALAAVLATLGTGTLSWAAATGRLEPVLQRIGLSETPEPSLQPSPSPQLSPSSQPSPSRSPTPPPQPSPSPQPSLPTETVADAPAETAPPKKPVRRRTKPVEVDADATLYRDAHARHFHAADFDAALVAWDAYLAAHPTGRFAIEARFNRAVVLVRLRRFDDAAADRA